MLLHITNLKYVDATSALFTLALSFHTGDWFHYFVTFSACHCAAHQSASFFSDSRQVYVECAPDAIELFETHGPFPNTGAVVLLGDENCDCSPTDAERGCELISGGANGAPTFTLAFVDAFFGNIRHSVPKRPMMLRNVIGAEEFAEQVAVINRDMDRLSNPWKISYMVLVVSAMLVVPAAVLCALPLVLWGMLRLDSHWEIPIIITLVIFHIPIIGVFGGIVATFRTRTSSEKKLAAILEKVAAKWESRGIDWFFSEEIYRLTAGDYSKEHTERRVRVSCHHFAFFRSFRR